MTRRRLLRGLGGIAVGLPALRTFTEARSARARESGTVPKRIIMVSVSMGTIRALFTPDAVGSSFNFGPVTAPMEPFKDKTMVITNLQNRALTLTEGFSGHGGKAEAVFTGTLQSGAFTSPGSNHVDDVSATYSPSTQAQAANGPSVESVIGEHLRHSGHLFPAVNLAITTQRNWSDTVRTNAFFYEGPANPVTAVYHPGLAFDSLFAEVTEDGKPDPALVALRRRRKSVLDGVREAFVDLRQGLDAHDRAVLDEHADKIRQIELEMPVAPACTIPDDLPAAGEGFSAYDELGFTMGDYADLQTRIMVHAMACDVAPVGRLMFGRQQRPVFGIPLVDDAITSAGGWHSPIVHKAAGWASEDPVRVAGFTFFVQKFANLISQLDGIVEGPDGRTLLDNSLVVFGSDLGDGDGHRAHDLNFLICGGSDRGRWGTHFAGRGDETGDGDAITNNLLVTLLQLAGHTDAEGGPTMEFGLEGISAGPIPELMI